MSIHSLFCGFGKSENNEFSERRKHIHSILQGTLYLTSGA